MEHELQDPAPPQVERMDAADLMKALQAMEATFREPLTLFYVEDLSYRDIAEILNVPIGTVMSRLSRGKAILKQSLLRSEGFADRESKLS